MEVHKIDKYRSRVSTKSSAFEKKVGYSRAVKVGNIIHVSGTTAPGKDAQEQTKGILSSISMALEKLGSSMNHVVRTKIFVTDIERDSNAVGEEHLKAFGKILPACTMVQIPKLIDPNLVVEIEAYAVIPENEMQKSKL